MSTSRRAFFKKTGTVAALFAAAAGYYHTAKQFVIGLSNANQTADPISGNAAKPEYSVDPASGKLTLNPDQTVAYTLCMGCTTLCGVRVRIENASNRVLRVTGNPYHLLSSDPFLPYETPVKQSFVALSAYQEQGLGARSTACGRGNAVLEKLSSQQRIKTPLKRQGPRGSGRWVKISFEQLIKEVVEGGNLFGEGQVQGLRAIRDLKTPIDPKQPEFGPKANQLAIMPAFKDGRLKFAARFAKQSFGTINFAGHRSYCGLSMRSGYAALLDDWKKQPHLKPDFANAEFLLFIGTAPANAGNPFKRQGQLLAKARSDGKLKYVVVDPVLTNSDNLATADRCRWIPIKPGSDGALVMAMIRWILANKRYDENFLKRPSLKAAEANQEAAWSNASHLVIVEQSHAKNGKFLRHSDINTDGDAQFMIIDEASGKLQGHNTSEAARLFYDGMVNDDKGNQIHVKTSLTLLREQATKHSLSEYAKACTIAVETIIELATEFTSHGKRAAVDCHGGTMASNGFYNAYAIVMLNALVGNLNVKGGTSAGGGRYKDISSGPRYNLKKFPGMVKARGLSLGRNELAYEKSSEYKNKQAQGKNPYPAKHPWYPLSPTLTSEFLSAALNQYPYPLKALILWSSNPLYGITGLAQQIKEKIVDPKNLPLIVSIDPFINESNSYADYIVPDSVLYESWGWAGAWGGHLTKVNTARWPVVTPAQAKNANGLPIDMETFFIAVAKRMGLPGFGKNAISDKQGNQYALDRGEDFYLRAAANVAYDGVTVANADDEEIAISGVKKIVPLLQKTLKADEWRRVAYVYARGGRFENADQAYQANWLNHRYKKAMQIYNEQLASAHNSLSGQRYIGSPTWIAQTLADGTAMESQYPTKQWPFQLVSTKSQLQSSHTIGIASLQIIKPKNFVKMNDADAAKLGLKNGDRVRVTTPGGSALANVQIRVGLQPGVLGIEHGYGHHQLGAQAYRIDNQRINKAVGADLGININDLGFSDPKRTGLSVLSDWVVGSVARQGLPAKIEKA